jgi:hypothetical protein
VAYRLNGSPKTRALGKYPDLSLAEAREKLAALKAILREGGDPMAGRKAVRGLTLAEAADAYWSGRKDVSDAYRANALRGKPKREKTPPTNPEALLKGQTEDRKALKTLGDRIASQIGNELL